jgi:predicted nuclease of predicted toxin-antitoxin system
MKLLFDENLSPKRVDRLADPYPDSVDVDRVSLGSEPDFVIWEYAKTHGYILVSKDSDFHERSLLYGHPPKVVWIHGGNCTVRQVELILRNKQSELDRLEKVTYLVIL